MMGNVFVGESLISLMWIEQPQLLSLNSAGLFSVCHAIHTSSLRTYEMDRLTDRLKHTNKPIDLSLLFIGMRKESQCTCLKDKSPVVNHCFLDLMCVKVWNLANCKLKTNHIGHTGYLNTVTVSPDGSLCASGGKVRLSPWPPVPIINWIWIRFYWM